MHTHSLPTPPARLLSSSLLRQHHALVLLGLAFYCLILPALVVVPRWFPLPADIVVSASAVEGYNNQVAYFVTAGWVLSVVLCFALLERAGFFRSAWGEEVMREAPAARPAATSSVCLELLLVMAGTLIIYFPVSLARYGPYLEDIYFLNALHRMLAGQVPYRDFEFLYGPLMLYPAYGWTKCFGFSFTSYYAYMALLEGVVFGTLLLLVSRYYPRRSARWGVFLIVAVLVFDALLSPTHNGLRKAILSLLILLLFSTRPTSMKVIVVGSILLGLHVCYCHAYGAATAAAVLALYLVLFARDRLLNALRTLFAVVSISLLTWASVSLLLLGGAFGEYVTEAQSLSRQWAAGEYAFRFYWTGNSLAAFGLICLAAVFVGRFLGLRLRIPTTPRDRLLICGLAYSLIVLKSGLSRCDVWHIGPAVFVLVFAFLLPQDGGAIAIPRAAHRLALGLILLLAATYLIGIAPIGSSYARGLYRGSVDWLCGFPSAAVPSNSLRAQALELERSHPDAALLELADYLSAEPRRHLPVYFYEELWGIGMRVGIYKMDHLNDDAILSEERGRRATDFLARHPGTLIVMSKQRHARLQASPGVPSAAPPSPTLDSRTKTVASWLSSVHFTGVQVEQALKERRWRRLIGDYIKDRYLPVAEFGRYLVLRTIDREDALSCNPRPSKSTPELLSKGANVLRPSVGGGLVDEHRGGKQVN